MYTPFAINTALFVFGTVTDSKRYVFRVKSAARFR